MDLHDTFAPHVPGRESVDAMFRGFPVTEEVEVRSVARVRFTVDPGSDEERELLRLWAQKETFEGPGYEAVVTSAGEWVFPRPRVPFFGVTITLRPRPAA